MNKKSPNLVGNQGGKPKDQSDKKSPNAMESWGEKPEDQ